MFSLSYKAVKKTANESVQCGGTYFATEESANGYMDILAEEWYILEMNLTEKEYKPRKSVVYATTRSWE